jgi:hypothetical protein
MWALPLSFLLSFFFPPNLYTFFYMIFLLSSARRRGNPRKEEEKTNTKGVRGQIAAAPSFLKCFLPSKQGGTFHPWRGPPLFFFFLRETAKTHSFSGCVGKQRPKKHKRLCVFGGHPAKSTKRRSRCPSPEKSWRNHMAGKLVTPHTPPTLPLPLTLIIPEQTTHTHTSARARLLAGLLLRATRARLHVESATRLPWFAASQTRLGRLRRRVEQPRLDVAR